MRNDENICQYRTRQRAITALWLNAWWNQIKIRVILLFKILLLCNLTLSYYKLIEAKSGRTNLACLPGYISKYSTAFYFHILTQIFCFVYDGLLRLIYFRMFYSKNLTTFDNTYLISCWFHCVNVKLTFCETLTVINSVTRILMIESLYNFRTIKCWFTL